MVKVPTELFCTVGNLTIQTLMTSPNLTAESQRLQAAIAQIRASGQVAPAYCWLTISTVTRGLKTYQYARLVSEQPGKKPLVRSLGRLGSERHQHWQQAIARREAIVELEQQLKMVHELIDRQATTWNKLQRLLTEGQGLMR